MPPPPPASALAELELDLAHRARAGDEGALDQLYRRHRDELVRHALRLLQDEAEARDVVQEAFARALEALPRTRPRLRFRAWIYRITTNLCLRQLHRRRRWVPGDCAARQRDPGQDPEQASRRAQRVALLSRALQAMPERYRRILLLREQQDLSYEELARTLDLDRNRVKVTLHRARARLWALFLAHQLSAAAAPTEVACPELRRLLQGGGRQARLVRHLESCRSCRRRERRRAAELVALLPLRPARTHSAPGPPPQGALWPGWVVPLAVGCLIAAGVALIPTGGHRQPGVSAPPRPVQRSEAQPAAGAPLAGPGRTPAPTPRRHSVSPPGPKVARRGRARRARRPRARPDHDPALDLRLRHQPGDLQALRDGIVLPAQARRLRLGDVLVGGAAAPYSVLLPGGQWLQVRGQLRLDAVPLRGEPPSRVQVALLSGELRARASLRGQGLRIGLGASRCLVQQGELRARRHEGRYRVEALTAYATLRGPHAPRVLPPRTGLDLTRTVGFAHCLLPAPLQLAPARSRAPDPPRLSWAPTPGAAAYRVQLARDPSFRLLNRPPQQTADTSLEPGPLPPGRYYWRVVALHGQRQSVPSRARSFQVTPPVAANAR
jgi:RNA polymerase sigma-70 factor (ECF subfamily)